MVNMNIEIGILVFWLTFRYGTFYKDDNISLCGIIRNTCPDDQNKWKAREMHMSCKTNKRYACMRSINGSLMEACVFVGFVPPNTTGCPVFGDCDSESGLQIVTYSNYKPCNSSLVGCPPEVHDGYNTTTLFQFPQCVSDPASEKPGVVDSPSKLPMILGCIAVTVLGLPTCIFLYLKRREIREFVNNVMTSTDLNVKFEKAGSRDDFDDSEEFLNSVKTSTDLDEKFEKAGSSDDFDDSEGVFRGAKSPTDSDSGNKAEVTPFLPHLQDHSDENEGNSSGAKSPKESETENIADVISYLPDSQDHSVENDGIILKRQDACLDQFARVTRLPAHLGIFPRELIQYIASDQSSRILVRLEKPMFSLITNPPKIIKKVGQLNIWTKKYCDKFQADKNTGKKLGELVEEMRLKCDHGFKDAEMNMSRIKNRLEHIIQQFSNFEQLCQTRRKFNGVLQPVLNDIKSSTEECTKLCTDNLTRFKEMENVKNDISRTLKFGEEKLNRQIHKLSFDEASKNGGDEKEKNIAALQKLKESCKDAIELSRTMNNEWENIVRFFEMFEDIIKIHIERTIKTVNDSIKPVRVSSEDPYGEGLLKLVEVNRSSINENAMYAKIISQIYTHVSVEIISPCVEELRPKITYDSSDTSGDFDELKLHEKCDNGQNKIEELCNYLEQMKSDILRNQVHFK